MIMSNEISDLVFTLASAGMHVKIIKRLTVNYGTPKQYLNLNWADFLFFLVRRHVTFKLSVFHLW